MSLLAAVDLNWLLQFIITVFIVAFGLLHVVKNTASKYFVADENDNDGVSDWSPMTVAVKKNNRHMMTTTRESTAEGDACAVCGNLTKKKCSRCKIVMYCSEVCQRSHWRLEHKTKCKDFQLSSKSTLEGRKAYTVTSGGSSKVIESKEMLFPYEEFVEFFNWDKSGFPPCGLLNCGNSCFANVVLQCLAYTKALVAFLLDKGHRKECRRNDWCFLCEFQIHIERASQSLQPFSPINILSRLPNIGGNLGYGKQEDAHEFMRFAIDNMQSVCLDEFGGEKAVHPCSQETTLIQHIFGGHLQSQVICTKCKNVSNQFENMMDLTVEIHGDAASLEECLDQFTAKEWLHGDNMYKCDGCNDYVMAWKRLTVRRGPNILTVALKRFQTGRFGKLNKRISFPETLDLSPYMSEAGEDNNVYKLYAVIVHVDMLNASFFGHYICYIKDFVGNWYRIDDCKVNRVDLDEVLSQGAYMLLYSRICARPSSLYAVEALRKRERESPKVGTEDQTSSIRPDQCQSAEVPNNTLVASGSLPSDDIPETTVNSSSEERFLKNNSEDVIEGFENEDLKETYTVPMDVEIRGGDSFPAEDAYDPIKQFHELEGKNTLTLMDSSETDILNIEYPSSSTFEVKDETGCSAGIARECSMDNVPTQKHVNEKDRIQVDFSAELSSGVDKVGEKSANSREKSNVVQDAAVRLDGRHSSANLKPLFTSGFLGRFPQANLKPLFSPGFLDRNSQNKSFNGDGEVAVKLGKQATSSDVNRCTNGVVSHGISCDFTLSYSDSTRDWVKDSNGCFQNMSSDDVLQKQVSMCHEETGIVSNVRSEPANLAYPTTLDESTNMMMGC